MNKKLYIRIQKEASKIEWTKNYLERASPHDAKQQSEQTKKTKRIFKNAVRVSANLTVTSERERENILQTIE